MDQHESTHRLMVLNLMCDILYKIMKVESDNPLELVLKLRELKDLPSYKHILPDLWSIQDGLNAKRILTETIEDPAVLTIAVELASSLEKIISSEKNRDKL